MLNGKEERQQTNGPKPSNDSQAHTHSHSHSLVEKNKRAKFHNFILLIQLEHYTYGVFGHRYVQSFSCTRNAVHIRCAHIHRETGPPHNGRQNIKSHYAKYTQHYNSYLNHWSVVVRLVVAFFFSSFALFFVSSILRTHGCSDERQLSEKLYGYITFERQNNNNNAEWYKLVCAEKTNVMKIIQ